MLRVYKGEATKSHENTFFRHFAITLSSVFERAELDGVLLGMPKSLVLDDLQIDALLVTKGVITIIDFKDYSGDVTLPNEDNFRRGRWETAEGILVKGGSAPNPFDQMSRQRLKLIRIFERTLRNNVRVENSMISTMVCFCNRINIIGEIPGSFKLSFFIADKDTFATKMLDIIDVSSDTNLLDEKFLSYIRGKIFDAREYDLSAEQETAVVDASKNLIETNVAPITDITDKTVNVELTAIEDFIKSESRVMIITGTVGSGKENLSPLIRDVAHSAGFRNVEIMARSNRVRNNLLRTQDDVYSLYSTIYDFTAVSEDESDSKRNIPLGQLDYFYDSDEDVTQFANETLFIIEESQMITDSYRDDPLVQFGTGRLLSDLIEYLKLKEDNCPNKVVFIGDKFQLSIGEWEESCLNIDYFDNIELSVTTLELLDNTEPTAIQEACIQIANSIREEDFSELFIHADDTIAIVERTGERECISKLVKNPSSKILVYNNRQARDINGYVKKEIVKNGSQLASDDLVVFDNQIIAYSPAATKVNSAFPFDSTAQPFDFSEPKRINNGSFGIIQQVDATDRFESYGTIKDEDGNAIKLTFTRACIRLVDDSILVETYILEDFLYSEKTKIGSAKEQEFRAFLRILEEEEWRKHPYEESEYFKDMMSNSNNYVEIESRKYRDPNNNSKLTSQERAYRNAIRKNLMNDHASTYFKVHNAARVKFGWCLTVHRAMSYEWANVAFSTDRENQGRTNEDYFKWVYTGISRATHHVDLIRWRPITPFEKTEFGIASSVSKQQEFMIQGDGSVEFAPAMLVEYLLRAFGNNNLSVSDTNSKSYQELITVTDNVDKDVVLSFCYKKTGQIRYPTYVRGDKELYNSILDILQDRTSQTADAQANSPLNKQYSDLQRIVNGLSIVVVKTEEFQDIIELKIHTNAAYVQIWHSKDLMISKFNFMNGSKDLFDQVVAQIEEYYGI